jgi:hypothetical protein
VQNIINETIDNSDNHTAMIVKILDVEGSAQLPMDDGGQNNMYGPQPDYESTMVPGMNQDMEQAVPPQPIQYDQTMQTGCPGAASAAPVGAKPQSITWFWLMLLTIVGLLAVFLFMLLR